MSMLVLQLKWWSCLFIPYQTRTVNKSYGVNVAKLAKLPDAVLNRANVLLEALEENNIEHHLSDDTLKEAPPVTVSVVEKYLEGIDPMALSPIDALSTLIELKKLNEK